MKRGAATGAPSARGVEAGTVEAGSAPLGFVDAVALVVGIVVGAGIFRSPSVVAANAGGEAAVLLLWTAGGLVSLAGAMCYAELACAYPGPGGDYSFLRRALGRLPAFLFGWARLTVIPTGSLALLGFVFGDYASTLLPLGPHSSGLWAALLVVGLTALNAASIHHGRRTQNVLTAAVVLGLVLLVAVGLSAPAPAPAAAPPPGPGSPGLALVFVLLAYGGWNEAVYVSAEVRGRRGRFAAVLAVGLGLVTVLYVLANLGFLTALGLAGVARSDAVADAVLQRTLGGGAAAAVSVLIAAAVVTSANATILMGCRTNFTLGREYRLFRSLGTWSDRSRSPVNALLLQGIVTLALVAFGTATRRGFEAMVEYTAPVFWLFLLLGGVSLFVLRRREPDRPRPFRVPLYPLTPLLFCFTSGYLLYASLAYTGVGALVGVAVLASGLVPFAMALRRERTASHGRTG